MDDGHISDNGDEDQSVDGNVRGHVDRVVHQLTGRVSERPAGGCMLVGGDRRYYSDEAEIGDGEIQQQQVGDGAHVVVGQDDVDDETVSRGAEQRDDAVLGRRHDFEEEPSERALFARRR